jgi:pimeloyl-ACP methyl ester carboxylesterase
MTDIDYRTADVDGLTVFYREAGPADATTLVLLHGFPSASYMFRELIPLLADRFHIVAPDLPGFGKSDATADSIHPAPGYRRPTSQPTPWSRPRAAAAPQRDRPSPCALSAAEAGAVSPAACCRAGLER